eukprot:s3270_g3.t2
MCWVRSHNFCSAGKKSLLEERPCEGFQVASFRASPRRREAPKTRSFRASELHPEDAKLRRHELQSFTPKTRSSEDASLRASGAAELHPNKRRRELQSFRASQQKPKTEASELQSFNTNTEDGSFRASELHYKHRRRGASELQSFTTNTEDEELQSFRASDRFRNHAANPVEASLFWWSFQLRPRWEAETVPVRKRSVSCVGDESVAALLPQMKRMRLRPSIGQLRLQREVPVPFCCHVGDIL